MNLRPTLLIRDSWRYWSRKPWQALFCLLLLSSGCAAVAILWTITDVVVRKPLPFPDGHELYGVQSVDEKSGEILNYMALADFRDFRERQTAFEGLFAYRGDFLNYRDASDTTRQLFAARVTRDFAEVLRIHPQAGRLFAPQDFASEAGGVAVISHQLWQQEFSGRADAVGTSMWFDDHVYEIIGIMPKSYNEPAFADVWTPFPDVTGEYFVRDARYWSVAGRLKPGVPVASAKAEVQQIAASLAEEYPATNKSRGATIDQLQTIMVGDFSTPLTLILIAVSLVMLATCLNLANLQLISGLQRRMEVGIRQAMGESQGQAFARVLMESTAICLAGCGLGWAMAAAFIANIDRILPRMLLPRLHEVSLSGSLGWIILAIALIASICFGLLPAIQAARANTAEILKSGEGRHGLTAESRRSRTALLATQIAVAVLILHGALLVVNEYNRLKRLDLGFSESNLTMITVSPGESRMFDLPALSLYYDEIGQWIQERPGVQSATAASAPPLWGFDLESTFQLQGYDLVSERDEAVTAAYNSISHNFMDTLGIQIVTGRSFNEWDARDAERVAIVNQAFVKKYLDGKDPLAQHVQIQSWMEPQFRRIVGVAGDYAQINLTDDPKPQIFVPSAQTPWVFNTFIARARHSDQAWLDQLQAELSQRFPDLGVTISTMDDLLGNQLAIQSILYALFLGFGGATLLLSLFGIGSQMAFNVTERSREWGIRLALGARSQQLNLLVVKHMMRPLAYGIAAGVALFAITARLHRSFGDAGDAHFIAASLGTLAAVALAAAVTTWLISARITRVEPQNILKSI